MAEMPRYSDTSNVQAQYARRMVQKYQIHRECYPSRCFKGYGGKVLSKYKYGGKVYVLFTNVGVKKIL